MDLQRRRRIERDLLNEARERLERNANASDVVDMELWFGQGWAFAMEESELRRIVNDLTDQIADTLRELTECNSRCIKPKQTSSLFRRPLPYAIGGALVGGVLIARGSDRPVATIASPPPAAPTPAATPPPPPPATPPTVIPPATGPTIAGVADCTRCEVIDDAGRHNAVINLCPQLTGGFEIAVASITIRHPAPFVDLAGAQYDQPSGVFRGTARGTVAGISNVGIIAEGTANASTGEIRFTYTMGTGGELPGGRPITYSITLQKRR
jgi:hypothetical protein